MFTLESIFRDFACPVCEREKRKSSVLFLVIFQFEPVAGDMSSERSRSRELAEKIAKQDPLNVNKVFTKCGCLVEL